MKRLRFIFLLVIIFIVTTSFLSIDVDITGKVYSDNLELNKELFGIELFAKYTDRIVAKTFVDKTGHYEITINVGLSDGLKNTYDFYMTSLGADTCFIKSFRQFDGEEMTWDIKLPNAYVKVGGRTVCPKCGTTEMVFPIIYGDRQLNQQKIINGDTINTNIVQKKYYAGTCIHSRLSPNWYCDRDKIKF
jgi:hypothetical protein